MPSPIFTQIPTSLQLGCDWKIWKKSQGGTHDALDFADAQARFEEAPHRYEGVGIALSREGAYVSGVAKDAVGPEGAIREDIQGLINDVPTYWEITANGADVRFIARAPYLGAFEGNGLSVYSESLFFPITGQRITDVDEPIVLNRPQLRALRDFTRHVPSMPNHDVLIAMKDKGLYQRPVGNGRHVITCPWWQDHPEMSRHGSIYTEREFGADLFECQHCHGKDLSTLLKWLGLITEAELPFVFPGSFDLSPTQYTVDQWLPKGEPSLLYSEKDMLKSFVAVDLFMSVVSGESWHRHATIPGVGIYIAGEGNHGLQLRMAGWCHQHHVELNSLPLALSTRPLRVLDNDAISIWREYVKRIEAHFNSNVAIIVMDTLASNFGRGDENSTSDIAEWLARVSGELCPQSDASVLIVHHTGKDANKGPRGAYALEANTNAIFNIRDVEHDGAGRAIDVVSERMKDAALPAPIPLLAKKICIPPHGLSTLVLVDRLSAQEQKLLGLIREGHNQREIAQKMGLSQSKISRMRDALKGIS